MARLLFVYNYTQPSDPSHAPPLPVSRRPCRCRARTPWAQAASGPLNIGYIYPEPLAHVGWTCQHDLGRKLIEKEFRPRIQTVFDDDAPESTDAECMTR